MLSHLNLKNKDFNMIRAHKTGDKIGLLLSFLNCYNGTFYLFIFVFIGGQIHMIDMRTDFSLIFLQADKMKPFVDVHFQRFF